MSATLTLRVVIEASTKEQVQDMLESLARSACDIANSTDDDNAHIWISERWPRVWRVPLTALEKRE